MEQQIPGPSIAHVCKLFNCTPAQVAANYEKNAEWLRQAEAKARASGKKYRGCTAEQHAERAAFFSMKAAEARFVAAA